MFGPSASSHLSHAHLLSPFAAAAAAASAAAAAAAASPTASPGAPPGGPAVAPVPPSPFDQSRIDKLDPMQNQPCRVCDEPAAGFHFGAFTCEGCKSFFGRTCNNQAVIQECKNNYRCVINKKNRTACKACRLRKCIMVGMSKSGSRYGRRSNWFKIHCLMQQANSSPSSNGMPPVLPQPAGHVSPPASAGSPLRSTTSPLTSSPPGLWRPLEASSPQRKSPTPATTPSSLRARRSPSRSPLNTTTGSSSAASLDTSAKDFTAALLKHQLQSDASSSAASQAGSAEAGVDPLMAQSLAVASLAAPRFPAYPAPPASSGPPPPASFPFLSPSTFQLPLLAAGLPLHKQALLSPLLASSQFLAAAVAARKAYPGLFSPASSAAAPATTTTSAAEASPAEALLEKFKASLAQAAVEANAAGASPGPESGAVAAPVVEGAAEDDASSVDSLASDSKFPHLSDTDDDVEPEAKKRRREADTPLDLTCA